MAAFPAPVVPVLHPSYQPVGVSRLGDDREGYERALASALREAGAGAGADA